jgi:hypothetical protein
MFGSMWTVVIFGQKRSYHFGATSFSFFVVFSLVWSNNDTRVQLWFFRIGHKNEIIPEIPRKLESEAVGTNYVGFYQHLVLHVSLLIAAIEQI